jgi:hypothetical protein
METVRVLAAVLGVVVVLGTLSSVVRTLVVPRGLRSKLSAWVSAGTRGVFQAAADRTRDYERKDAILAWGAPLSILVVLVAWLLAFMLGYALMLYGLSELGPRAALREAGSSLFTLGFASSDRDRLTYVDFVAAATGPVVVGLLVGYLPTLYSAYNRREAEVTLLQSRAGEPNWGPEILARHAAISTLENLRGLFAGWERWAADVSESHSNYPVLMYIRSPVPQRNWLVGLLSVMDAAALQLALNPSMPQGEARLAVRAGFSCLRELARAQRIPYDPDPSPDNEIQLTRADFDLAIRRLRNVDYPMERTPDVAWVHFRGWRVNYEAIAYTLLRRIDAVPALWSGPRRTSSGSMAPVTPENRQPGGTSGPITPGGRPKPGGGTGD